MMMLENSGKDTSLPSLYLIYGKFGNLGKKMYIGGTVHEMGEIDFDMWGFLNVHRELQKCGKPKESLVYYNETSMNGQDTWNLLTRESDVWMFEYFKEKDTVILYVLPPDGKCTWTLCPDEPQPDVLITNVLDNPAFEKPQRDSAPLLSSCTAGPGNGSDSQDPIKPCDSTYEKNALLERKEFIDWNRWNEFNDKLFISSNQCPNDGDGALSDSDIEGRDFHYNDADYINNEEQECHTCNSMDFVNSDEELYELEPNPIDPKPPTYYETVVMDTTMKERVENGSVHADALGGSSENMDDVMYMLINDGVDHWQNQNVKGLRTFQNQMRSTGLTINSQRYKMDSLRDFDSDNELLTLPNSDGEEDPLLKKFPYYKGKKNKLTDKPVVPVIGVRFDDNRHLCSYLRMYGAYGGFDINVYKKNFNEVSARCTGMNADGVPCPWRIHASTCRGSTFLMI